MESPHVSHRHRAWNKGKVVGQKAPFKIKEIWAIRVRLQMQDLDGDTVELQGEEVAARIYLHEVDHLNGILFIDHLARHDRKEAMRRIRAGELEHPPPPDRGEPPAG